MLQLNVVTENIQVHLKQGSYSQPNEQEHLKHQLAAVFVQVPLVQE